MKKHLEIVEQIKNEYVSKETTVAVNLFGSLAAGTAHAQSDIDIEIITTEGDDWEFLKKKIEGIDVDLVICPQKHLEMQFSKYPYLCYAYLDEKILYDPTSFMKDIVTKIRTYFDEHPEIVSFWKENLKIMKENKAKGKDLKNAMAIYDKAEILFSKEKKVTRDFFRE